MDFTNKKNINRKNIKKKKNTIKRKCFNIN